MENILDNIEYFRNVIKVSIEGNVYVNFPFSCHVHQIFNNNFKKEELNNIYVKKFLFESTSQDIEITQKNIQINNTLNNLATCYMKTLRGILSELNPESPPKYEGNYENIRKYINDNKLTYYSDHIYEELGSYIYHMYDGLEKVTLNGKSMLPNVNFNKLFFNITTRKYNSNIIITLPFAEFNNFTMNEISEDIYKMYTLVNEHRKQLSNFVNNVSNNIELNYLLYLPKSAIVNAIPDNIKNYYVIYNMLNLMETNIRNTILMVNKNREYDNNIIASIEEYIGEIKMMKNKVNFKLDMSNNIDKEFIFFEFMKGFFVRDIQKMIIKNIIANYDSRTFNSYNMLMGAGKTSVVLPLVTHIINSNRNKSVIAVVPHTLINQTASNICEIYGYFYENRICVRTIGKNSVNIVSDTFMKTMILNNVNNKYENCYILFDEMDSVMDPIKSELNVIKDENIEYNKYGLDIYDIIKHVCDYFIEHYKNNIDDYPHFNIKKINNKYLTDIFCKAIMGTRYKDIFGENIGLFVKKKVLPKHENNIRTYNIMHIIYIIYQISRNIFSKIHNKHYGFRNNNYFAVPFVSDKTPSESSEFSSIYYIISYTYLSAIYGGIQKHNLVNIIDCIWKNYKIDPIGNASVIESISTIFGYDNKEKPTLTIINTVYDQIKTNKLLVDIYVKYIVKHKLYVNTKQKNCSAYDLISSRICYTKSGFTGTPYVPYVVDKNEKIGYSNKIFEHNGELYENKYDILKDEYVLDKEIKKVNNNELMKDISKLIFEKKISALIDVDSILLKLSVENIAEYLVNTFRESKQWKKKYIVFINKSDKIKYVDIDFPDVVMKYVKNVLPLDDIFIYFDQRHITGIDIKQSINANALVLCNTKTKYRDFSQGIYRMRKLGKDKQQILIAIPSTDHLNTWELLLESLKINDTIDKQNKENIALLQNCRMIERITATDDAYYINNMSYIMNPSDIFINTKQIELNKFIDMNDDYISQILEKHKNKDVSENELEVEKEREQEQEQEKEQDLELNVLSFDEKYKLYTFDTYKNFNFDINYENVYISSNFNIAFLKNIRNGPVQFGIFGTDDKCIIVTINETIFLYNNMEKIGNCNSQKGLINSFCELGDTREYKLYIYDTYIIGEKNDNSVIERVKDFFKKLCKIGSNVKVASNIANLYTTNPYLIKYYMIKYGSNTDVLSMPDTVYDIPTSLIVTSIENNTVEKYWEYVKIIINSSVDDTLKEIIDNNNIDDTTFVNCLEILINNNLTIGEISLKYKSIYSCMCDNIKLLSKYTINPKYKSSDIIFLHDDIIKINNKEFYNWKMAKFQENNVVFIDSINVIKINDDFYISKVLCENVFFYMIDHDDYKLFQNDYVYVDIFGENINYKKIDKAKDIKVNKNSFYTIFQIELDDIYYIIQYTITNVFFVFYLEKEGIGNMITCNMNISYSKFYEHLLYSLSYNQNRDIEDNKDDCSDNDLEYMTECIKNNKWVGKGNSEVHKIKYVINMICNEKALEIFRTNEKTTFYADTWNTDKCDIELNGYSYTILGKFSINDFKKVHTIENIVKNSICTMVYPYSLTINNTTSKTTSCIVTYVLNNEIYVWNTGDIFKCNNIFNKNKINNSEILKCVLYGEKLTIKYKKDECINNIVHNIFNNNNFYIHNFNGAEVHPRSSHDFYLIRNNAIYICDNYGHVTDVIFFL